MENKIHSILMEKVINMFFQMPNVKLLRTFLSSQIFVKNYIIVTGESFSRWFLLQEKKTKNKVYGFNIAINWINKKKLFKKKCVCLKCQYLSSKCGNFSVIELVIRYSVFFFLLLSIVDWWWWFQIISQYSQICFAN